MISVIIPLYNKRETIARTIESVQSQTYRNWELIIVDDGSTDGSGNVVTDYLSDSRIKLIHKSNSGVSATRNMAIQQAMGEWLVYIDADDYFLPNALETLFMMTEKYGLDIVSGNYYAETDGVRTPVLRHVKEGVVANNFRSLYFGSFDIRAGATLYRTSLIKQYHFDESLVRYEDAKIEFDILRSHKVAITSEFILVYSQDFNELSRPCSDFSKDFISCMSFEGKTLWEKMFLGRLLGEGLVEYPGKRDEIKAQYRLYLKWMYGAKMIGYCLRLRNKFLNMIP